MRSSQSSAPHKKTAATLLSPVLSTDFAFGLAGAGEALLPVVSIHAADRLADRRGMRCADLRPSFKL
jgi:hypothetical protein